MLKRQFDISDFYVMFLQSSLADLFHHPVAHLWAKLELWIHETTEIGVTVLLFWMQQQL